MADKTKEKKQYRVVFIGTKKEVVASTGSKYSKFINSLVHQYANVSFKIFNI